MSGSGADPFRSDPFSDTGNPFAAPRVMDTPAAANHLGQPLADRSSRFVGALVDSVILLPFAFGAAFGFAILWSRGIAAGGSDLPAGDFLNQLITLMAVSIAYLAINGYLLAHRGQTIGKLLVGTRIVDARTGEIPPLMPLFLKRFLIIQLMGLLPWLGVPISLVNALLIFRANRRCLHDDLASTQVVKVIRSA